MDSVTGIVVIPVTKGKISVGYMLFAEGNCDIFSACAIIYYAVGRIVVSVLELVTVAGIPYWLAVCPRDPMATRVSK